MRKPSVEIARSFAAVGFSYSTAPYWSVVRQDDPRPMLTVHLWWKVVWIRLPWSHSEQFGHGSATKRWGFYWKPLRPFRSAHVSCGWRTLFITSRPLRFRVY